MEHSTEKKLKNLLDLQAIDSKIFEIKKVRGALPDEVQDLEDELVGYNTRLDNFNSDIEEKNKDIDDLKNKSSEAKKLIKKYKDQQMNVRNNREYDAISKEIELQELDSKIFVKKSGENDVKIEEINEQIKATKKVIKEKKIILKSKKADLDVLSNESHEEEKKLDNLKAKASKKIEVSILELPSFLSVKNPRTPRKYQNAQKPCSVTIRTYGHIGRYTATSETLTEQRLQHALDIPAALCEYIRVGGRVPKTPNGVAPKS